MVLVVRALAPRSGQDPDHITNVAMYALIAGVVGARIFYIIHNYSRLRSDGKMKIRIYSVIFFVLVISFVNACADSGEITLVKDGKANAVIVIAEEPTIAANLAAVELQYHIEKITSASLPIKGDNETVQGNRILGGESGEYDVVWGSLYDESRRWTMLALANQDELKKVLRADDWNEYVIRCEGRHIQLWLNGHKTVDYTESDGPIEATGIIGVQIHGGPPSEAWYRNITIIEL